MPVATMPELRVELEDREIAPTAARTLSEVRVQQALSLPSLCEMTFVDPTDDLVAGSASLPGAALRLSVTGFGDPLFSGEVTAVEHVHEPSRGRLLRVRGYDRLHRLRKRQPVRAHVQVTVADLARDMTSGLRISVEASESGPVWQRVVQYRQSDLDLLGEMAERCGLHFTLREDVLQILTLEGSGDPLPLALGESLLEARLELNADPACRSVVATGWDPGLVELHRGSASRGRVGRAVPAEAPPGRVGGTGERTLVDEVVQDDRQAEALAQAELDARLAREVTLWGVAEGDPRLRPGTAVDLTGVADVLAGRYVLTAVTHTIDTRRGFVSEISTQPPPLRARPRSAILTTGTVTRVDDPDGLGRVQVVLPTYQDVETEWLGVVLPGAGSGKGLVTVPDVGDHVLVLLLRQDPGQGVVLGGLYGPDARPEPAVEGGRVRRFALHTPGGQRLRLDDVGASLRFENGAGSYVELSPSGVSLHARADLTIEAPGHVVRIRGKSVEFEQA